MAGAIAGTAILNCKLQSALDTVALTINNSCNLHCPHCYLQYDGPNESITSGVISLLSS
jgi:MoaA/NifB/PqqE/SkfB family radical SAM enzyme